MNQPNPYLIALCKQLETQIGFEIKNISNAKKCSEIMALEKLFISPHTIARIFGVVKPFRNPYEDTLNIISRYLNYLDWVDFCKNQTNTSFGPNYFLTESSDGFSLAVMQLALANEDFRALSLVLSKAKTNDNEAVLFMTAELIGTYIHKSKKQKELLQLLAENSVGHLLFFECYVDEDNFNGYFSDALIQYYLPKVTNDYRKLYVYCFVISQTAHKAQQSSPLIREFQKLTFQLDKNKCHFHELSRWMECQILIDGFGKLIKDTWPLHVAELIVLSSGLGHNEKAWLLSRSMKALVFFGLKEELFQHEELNSHIYEIIYQQKKEYSIALYVLQLYWICKSFYFDNKSVYNPFKINNILFQNESIEKAAIEFAVASLFATGENKTIFTRNLKSFCEKKRVHWVLKMLD